MKSIEVGRGERAHTFLLFTSKEEFQKHFGNDAPEYVHWRKAENRLDWIMTDQGGITQAIDVKWYGKTKLRKYITTVCGTVIDNNGSVLTNNMRKDRRDMWRIGSVYDAPKNPKTAENRILRSKVKWLLLFVVAGVTPENAFKLVYSADMPKLNPLGSKEKNKEMLDRVVSSNWGKKRMEKAVKEAANTVGLNHEYIMKGYMSLAEKAESSDKMKYDSLQKLAEIIETFPKEGQQGGPVTGGLFLGASSGGGHLPAARDREEVDVFGVSEDDLERPSE